MSPGGPPLATAATLGALLLPLPCEAARIEVPIVPPSATIDYTILVLGLFPIPASFERFGGMLSADPTNPAACDVHVTIDVASLHMEDESRRREALGPTMLDAARYPIMRFDGACDAHGVSGQLTLHGTTHPLVLTEHRQGNVVVSSGMLDRQTFGVSGLPHLVGRHITLRFTTSLPKAFGRLE